jgi:hypothetical protein
MKKLLLSFSLVLVFASTQAQNLFTFGFDGTTAAMDAAGWARTNQSTPAGASVWTIPTAAPTTTFAGGGQAGGAISFILVNFNSTTGAGIISNWLISPSITVDNGDVISFYTRIGLNSTTGSANYADNLELRMSTNGAFTTNPTGGSAGLGDFTNLLVEVNPALDLTSYPLTWGQYSYTVTGLTGPTDVKLGFRYFVPDGGPTGANSDIIGLDTVSVDRPLTTDSFFKNNFSVWPNPTSNVINVSNNTNSDVTAIQITDMNGRTIREVKGMTSQINIADLNSGVYFMKIISSQGTGTTKIIKR